MEGGINELPVKLNEDGFYYKVRELTDLDFKVLGPDINREIDGEVKNVPLVNKDVTDYFNLVAIEEFYRYNADKTKIMMFRENETFPIYGFINKNKSGKEWVKIYMPKGKKSLQPDGKDFRFQHLGHKSPNFIYGLDNIRELFNKKSEEQNEADQAEIEKLADNADKFSLDELIKLKTRLANKKFQFDRICIATGGSDGFNLRAFGELVIFKNSETDHFSDEIMKELFVMAKEVVNIPDLDFTGVNAGIKFALEHVRVSTFWMNEFTPKTNVKDFKDYAHSLRHLSYSKLVTEVKKNLELAKPAKFWEKYTAKSGNVSYNFNKQFGTYFLQLNGFLRVDDESRKDQYYFAKLHGHIVEELKSTLPIKDYFKNFLIAQQKKEGRREIPYELINTMIDQPKMSDSNLASLQNRDLDFTDYDAQSQYFFFTDKIWKVTRDGTREIKNFKNYVLKSQLIDELIFNSTGTKLNTKRLEIDENQFKKDESGNLVYDEHGKKIEVKEPYFTIRSLGEDLYGIDIHKKDCDILNFLIQTSRVHWEVERAGWIADGHKEEDFFEKTKFQITSKYLTEEQNQEQEMHLVNKIFTIGYGAHRFKDPARPWVPWGVDNAVSEDKAAEGGSGKGIFGQIFTYIQDVFMVNGKSDFQKDRFWLENVTKHTDSVIIDDVERNFTMDFLYSMTTGHMEKDTKNVSKETISKKDSPKFFVFSNHAITDTKGSTIRRRLLFAMSDIYHSKSDKWEERNPTHDFGYNLFEDWKEKQWFYFVNAIAQMTSFYLSCAKKIPAPENNIMRRTWLAKMGDQFKEWADDYFPERNGLDIPKFEAEDSLKAFAVKNNYQFLKGITVNNIKAKIEAWANYNEYTFEDRYNINLMLPVKDANGITLMNAGEPVLKRTSKEHIKLTKKIEYTEEDNSDDDMP